MELGYVDEKGNEWESKEEAEIYEKLCNERYRQSHCDYYRYMGLCKFMEGSEHCKECPYGE